jgi:hypothetical protein
MATKTTDPAEEVAEDQTDEEVENDSSDETTSEPESKDDTSAQETDDQETEPHFHKRFTQFQGDEPEEYAKNLEVGYENSSKEAVRLSREVKELKAQLANKSQSQEATDDQTNQSTTTNQATDPELDYLKGQAAAAMEEEYAEFAMALKGKGYDLDTDEALAEELDTALAKVAAVHKERTGRTLTMKKGLDQAWLLLGKDDSKEQLAAAAKNTAGQTKTGGATKTQAQDKPIFTKAQVLATAKMLNLSEAEALKKMQQHATK